MPETMQPMPESESGPTPHMPDAPVPDASKVAKLEPWERGLSQEQIAHTRAQEAERQKQDQQYLDAIPTDAISSSNARDQWKGTNPEPYAIPAQPSAHIQASDPVEKIPATPDLLTRVRKALRERWH